MSTAAFDLGNTPSTPPSAPTAAEKVQLQKAIGIDATGYMDTTVSMSPTFSESYVYEGSYTPPTGWRDMIIICRVDLSSTSAYDVLAALQIKTTSVAYVVPWAIPVASTDSEVVDPRVTVIRLQRAKDAVFLNTYMSNSSYTNDTFLSEMNNISPAESLSTYNLGNSVGGGSGGSGTGGTGTGGTGGDSVSVSDLLGMHQLTPAYIRPDSRVISACIAPVTLTTNLIMRLNLSQSSTLASTLNLRILTL
jgi:hypothetical protein